MIIGAGYAGRYAALRLSRQVSNADVTLVNGIVSINASEALIPCDPQGAIDTITVLEITTAGIHGIFLTRNPDKLHRLGDHLNLYGK
ncbi:MAG TPA: hypothetical protein VMT34_09810 [Aggregatilineales bacterium]|nr:hypothetical protein [Aggregatilineales bacterium]